MQLYADHPLRVMARQTRRFDCAEGRSLCIYIRQMCGVTMLRWAPAMRGHHNQSCAALWRKQTDIKLNYKVDMQSGRKPRRIASLVRLMAAGVIADDRLRRGLMQHINREHGA